MMQYDFKVDLAVYKYFVDEVDESYLNQLKETYNEFRIIYNNTPSYAELNLINAVETDNDYNQILLLGINDNAKEVLCYYHVGDDDGTEYYKEGLEFFNEILKYKI